MYCINIDRLAPKTFKLEALYWIDRQSMFMNLKVDEKSHEESSFLQRVLHWDFKYIFIFLWIAMNI